MVSGGLAGVDGRGHAPPRKSLGGPVMTPTTSLVARAGAILYPAPDATERQASPHTINCYRDTFRQFLRIRTTTARSIALAPDLRADRRTADHRVPGGARGPPRPERSKPQSAPHRDPFLLSLRGVRAPDARSTDPESARHPEQAIHAQAGQLSQPPGGRCVACGAGSEHMVETTRSRLHPHCGANGASARQR